MTCLDCGEESPTAYHPGCCPHEDVDNILDGPRTTQYLWCGGCESEVIPEQDEDGVVHLEVA